MVLLAVLVGLLAAFAVPPPRWTSPGRAGRFAARPGPASLHPRSVVERAAIRTGVCAGGLAVVAFTWWGVGGAVAGAAAGAAVSWWVGRLEPAGVARRRRQVGRDLPTATDLLASCLMSGLPWEQALPLVADAVPGPVGEAFSQLHARVRLGSDLAHEWRRLAADPAFAPLARAVVRTLRSGAPMAEVLGQLAADRRRDLRAQRQAAAKSAGVRAAGPLALCFLPAFMVVGVVPTIVGAVGGLLR